MRSFLRPAADADRDFLYALHRAAMREYVERTWGWDETWQRAHFDAHFTPEAVQLILADGSEVGALRIKDLGIELCLASVAVLPEAQGRGIGTAVIQQLLASAARRRLPVALQVLRSNPRARRLYERLGFRLVGETATHFQLRCRPSVDSRGEA